MRIVDIHLDKLHTLLCLERHAVIVARDFDGAYEVYLRDQCIASGPDLLKVAEQAWRVICADAAVRGAQRPLLKFEEAEQRRRHDDRIEAMKYQLQEQYVRDQSFRTAQYQLMGASQKLLGEGKASKDRP